MKHENGRLLFSATDLAHHLSCPHLTELERRVAEGTLKRDHYHDPVLELLIELGVRHENAYVEFLRGQRKRVAEFSEFGASVDQTLDAMRQGFDVVAQASLVGLPWRGRADFLLKVDRPSNLGPWSYEVADTKLAQTTRAGTVLQLCLYTELLAAMQGVLPEAMYVVRPGDPFEVEKLRVADYLAYYRMVKHRFESDIAQGPRPESYPEPNSHCQRCSWWRNCDATWRADDHLTLVAGMGKSQISELRGQSIHTLEAFAGAEAALPNAPKRGSMATFERLQRQARIQLDGRETGEPKYVFNQIEESRGFCRLPAPSAGDVYFDLEGYPRAVGDSLEYLFGYVTVEGNLPVYHHQWGLTKREEKQAFVEFMKVVMGRWAKWPDMHIYHFAPYEPSALKRLATRHAVCEEELDQLLRGERLVDLYAITRQAITASVESYSIKQLEQFYGYGRDEDLLEASRSLRGIERMIELDLTDQLTAEHRQVVERYNRDDCVSTLRLREWLEQLREELQATGQQILRPAPKPGDPSEAVGNRDAEVREVFEQLVADIGDEPKGEAEEARWLLAHMLEYFRREDKCAWWEYFRLHELEHDELLQERKAITGLTYEAEIPSDRTRMPVHRYRFPPQEAAVEVDDGLFEVGGNSVGEVAGIDHVSGFLDIRKRGDSIGIHPTSVFSFSYVHPREMPVSLLEFGRDLLQGEPRSGRYDLLAKRAPRLKSLSLPLENADPKDAAIRLAFDLDHSYLPIQGPPGAGKTFVGSHMISELAKAGKRVGVSAVSHKVILNLLSAVRTNSGTQNPVVVAHMRSDGPDGIPSEVIHLGDRDAVLEALAAGNVVGGTAWLWSHAEIEDQLDYLFIDEAGQMSLAMAMAAGRAAKNIVLLGDPQQLEQPQQGTHPEGAGVAALDHVLDGAETLPNERGLFLQHTWRLHPSICNFTSETYYDFRLRSQAGLENQAISGNDLLLGHGLRFLPVTHEENQHKSPEEVAVVTELVHRLLDGGHRWTNMKGDTELLSLENVLVVAPYNSQVNALRDALPAGARVGTVDKFQGQEAPVVIYSLTSSSVLDAPRGMNFLLSRNRMNVATSRARCLAILVGSPKLLVPHCENPKQMRLANGFCRFLELATEIHL